MRGAGGAERAAMMLILRYAARRLGLFLLAVNMITDGLSAHGARAPAAQH